MRRPRFWLGLAAGALVPLAACAAAESPRAVEPIIQIGPLASTQTLGSFTLVPGVVADPARDLVYVMRPEGGIEALDLADGSLLWATGRADQPLFVADNALVALVESTAPGLSVTMLDPATGNPVTREHSAESVVLPLPSGIAAAIDQTLARSFKFSIVESGGEIYLTWEYIERDVTGISPPGGRAFARRETGAFRFRARAGDDARAFDVVALESIPEPVDPWPAEVRELLESKQVLRPPWRTGKVLAITQQRYAPDELVLKRWRRSDGEALEVKSLHRGRALAVLASCDERHAVVAVASGDSIPESRYLLRFHSLETGDLVLEVSSERSAGPFCLLGSRLLRLSLPTVRRVGDVMVESPLELVAGDVESGAVVWRRAVRDTVFRGPAPPRS